MRQAGSRFWQIQTRAPQRQERFVRRIKEQGVDGVILCAAVGTTPALVAQLNAWRIPCVQILRTVDGAESDFVGPDFRQGDPRPSSDHLVALGHTRIALLPSSKNTSASRDRVEAFLSVHATAWPGAWAHPRLRVSTKP